MNLKKKKTITKQYKKSISNLLFNLLHSIINIKTYKSHVWQRYLFIICKILEYDNK